MIHQIVWILGSIDGGAVRREDPESFNDLHGEFIDIGGGGFNRWTIDSFGLANEPDEFGIPVGYSGDIRGQVHFQIKISKMAPIGTQTNESSRCMPLVAEDHCEYTGAEASKTNDWEENSGSSDVKLLQNPLNEVTTVPVGILRVPFRMLG